MKALVTIIIVFGTCLPSLCNPQDQTKSLVDIANESRQKQKDLSHQAAKTFTDDNYVSPARHSGIPKKPIEGKQTVQSEIPDINFNGPDNSDAILEKLRTLKKDKGSAEAETALHSWYDKYDSMLQDKLVRLDALRAKKKTTELDLAENVEVLQLVGLSLQIEGEFLQIYLEASKLGLNVDWFQFRCSDGTIGDCRKSS